MERLSFILGVGLGIHISEHSSRDGVRCPLGVALIVSRITVFFESDMSLLRLRTAFVVATAKCALVSASATGTTTATNTASMNIVLAIGSSVAFLIALETNWDL